MSDVSRVEEIFLGALDKASPDQCAAYLDERCQGEAELRRQVERLLLAHPGAQRFLEVPGPNASPTVDLAPEISGKIIGGRYKLLEPIGEGGMGSVWMAQQTEPVKRTVALKLIKAGMDTKAVLARFEAERQALALMDHPNIAKVLDAGASDDGRPFFVMELVKGIPITRYCDDRKLTLRQRLDLFIPVCHAVQHAHQKGIIHRDLKPSNVLVAQYDDLPVPKVIDFGVAKAAGQPLTDRTLVTGFGAVVGTPEYMSPEQAQFNQLDVDTRSDIYALGVLLYELLTGSTPVDRRQLETAGLLEVLRIIREQEPPRPSTRISTAQGLPQIAANRGSEARTLAGLLRNDLDWIVMKSLEKDRNRRYETATGFAADVQRYLAGEPVQAHPPGAAYRVRKFVRKHQIVIATASAFLGMLITSVGVSGALAVNARRARSIAEVRRIEAEKNLERADYNEGRLHQSMVTATENAAEARQNADAWAKVSEQYLAAVFDAEIRLVALKMDFDLAEVRTDPRVGLLRLARPLKHTYGPVRQFGPNFEGNMEGSFGGDPRFVELREFATLAVLATGQMYAPLSPPEPLVDGGLEFHPWQIDATGQRILTLDGGRTVKLWEKTGGRLIATLREGDEKAVSVGFSPDGSTVYTHSWDGVVRFWEAEGGRLRARTEPRPDRLKLIGRVREDRLDEYHLGSWVNVLSDDRMLTASMVEKMEDDFSTAFDFQGPDELWDSRTGRLIARLEGRGLKQGTFQFFARDRWIRAVGQDNAALMFSAVDGRPVVRLDRDEKPVLNDEFAGTTPSGRSVATIAHRNDGAFVFMWDASTLRLTSVTGPIATNGRRAGKVGLIADDLFTIEQDERDSLVFRCGNAAPIGRIPRDQPIRSEGGLLLLSSGRLYDMKTWKQLQPPTGRRYHPDLAKFAPDGRLINLGRDRSLGPPWLLVDTATEKTFPGLADWRYRPPAGWVQAAGPWSWGRHSSEHRLPPRDRLKVPPDLLELWAQVVVRGHLDDDGRFVKWDEPTWETKREELAAKPAPIPDFPFPGHVAADRLHWLRQEFEEAGEAEKPRLAKQLLDRALATGDEREAVHWRALLPQQSERKEPSAAK